MSLFAGILLLQLWLVWQFTTEQLAALRDRQERQHIRSKLESPSERRQRQKEKKAESEAGGDSELRQRNPTTPSPKSKSEKKSKKWMGRVFFIDSKELSLPRRKDKGNPSPP